jgi:hypothetical protein
LRLLRLCIVLMMFPQMVRAQFMHEVYDDTTAGYVVGVFGRYQMASNAISASMLNAIYTGSELTRDMRDGSSARLGESNRLGLDGDYGLFVRHLPDSVKGVGWFIRIADRYHAHANLSRDLLDLAMFGNAQFAGRTAELGNLSFNYLQYKQYEFGILKNWKRPSAEWFFGMGLSLLTGNQSAVADIPDGTLYTHPDGEYLDVEVHGVLRTSSIASTQFFAANGWGFSASAHLGMRGKRFGWMLQLDDLGMISWSERLRQHDIDTLARFEGPDIDLFATNPFASVNFDTIASRVVTSRDGERFSTVIPGSIRVEAYYALNEKQWKLYAGVQHRFAEGYFPLVYLGTSAPLPKQFFIDGRFAWGGFGSWNIGLELRKKFGKYVAVRLGSYNLEGYLMPGIATGQSAYFGLTGYF